MIDNLKKFLNEDQDPKAIEKISNKLNDMLMRGEEVGYIAVQKKPVTVMPDSIVLTNKRIIVCKPKNLGLSTDFIDYDWSDVAAIFVKENILGSEFSFSTNSELTITIDYIPKTQARRIATYVKEQLDFLKNSDQTAFITQEPTFEKHNNIDNLVSDLTETPTEEVVNLAEILPSNVDYQPTNNDYKSALSQDELFAKLQNYKKLLDNGLILQGEYDNLKKEILNQM